MEPWVWVRGEDERDGLVELHPLCAVRVGGELVRIGMDANAVGASNGHR